MTIDGDVRLSPDDGSKLRRSAYRSQHRESEQRRVPITFIDGPLDGVRITVLETEAQSWRLGFCTLTDDGLVQVLYESDGDKSRWQYAEMSSEGWRGTGWPAGQN